MRDFIFGVDQEVDDISLATGGRVAVEPNMGEQMAQIVEITSSGFVRVRITGVTDKKGNEARVEAGSEKFVVYHPELLDGPFAHPRFPDNPRAAEFRAKGPVTPDQPSGDPTFAKFHWEADADLDAGEDQVKLIHKDYFVHIVAGEAVGVRDEFETGEVPDEEPLPEPEPPVDGTGAGDTEPLPEAA